MTTDSQPLLPGGLGTPGMTLGEDPRTDPRLIPTLELRGSAGQLPPLPVNANSPIEALLAVVEATDTLARETMSDLTGDIEPPDNVTTTTETTTGVDGNEIKLYVHRPTDQSGPLPGVLHLHGGGMVFLEAADLTYVHWRNQLAARGMVVVGVEFRNGGGRLGPHPFPAGLNDCALGLQWMHDRRSELGLSKIVVSGESGGGNLSLATAIKAKREGRLDQIDGVYALCPYISNLWADRSADLPSLYENDGYVLSQDFMASIAVVYDPERTNATNPLAWPYHAERADLEGLPPHAISVNQLDPLRDEGLAYFAKLLDAGVPAVCRTVNGTPHGADVTYTAAIPDVQAATLDDIRSFAS